MDLVLNLVFSVTILSLKSGTETVSLQDTTSCSVWDREPKDRSIVPHEKCVFSFSEKSFY